MSQLEDIVWDEFGDNDDHIVPHPGAKRIGYAVNHDSSKRPRYELSYAENESASKAVKQRKEETSFTALKEEKETMLEKSPWSASLDGNSNRKKSCFTSEEARTSNKCVDDLILGDRTASMDNNLNNYQLNGESHVDNDLSFFGDNLQDKESSDLLYYGWPEIENFDDIDRMFRGCDSTLGLEIDNEEGFGWLSSSPTIEGFEDAPRSSFNFSSCDPGILNCVTEREKVYGLNSTDLLANDGDSKLTPVSWMWTSLGSSTVMNSSYVDGSGVHHTDVIPQNHKEYQKPSERKRQDCLLENDNSFVHFENLKQMGQSNLSLNFQSSISSETHQQQETPPEKCFQTPILLKNLNNGHLSTQVLASPTSSSIIKSEDNSRPSISVRESSYASNQMQSIENSHDVSLQNHASSGNKKKDRRKLSGHPEKSNLMFDPVFSQKQVPKFENEVEGQSETNVGDIGIQGELDSSNNSSCISSLLDEVSIEASSFRQLRHVMDQLDIRTKLCIRDSLYRLARSAEQRHKCVNQTSGGRDDKDASGTLIPDEENKCTGFMDMETDTNPIDRSIAHLLFHRPSEPSATAALDAVPVKTHTMGQTPNHGSVMAHKLVSQKETITANDEAVQH